MYVFTCIGLFAISMQCCWKKVSASQFTIYMTIGNMGRIVGAKLIGPMKLSYSWETTILLFSGILLIGLIALQFLHINNHLKHVENLDLKYSSINQPYRKT
jgi:PAT family beta-lactamase induction signal transducer AmpG